MAIIRTLILVVPNLHIRYRNTSTLPDLLEHLNTLLRLIIHDYEGGKSRTYSILFVLSDPRSNWPNSVLEYLQIFQSLHGPKEIDKENCVHRGAPKRDAKLAHVVKRYAAEGEFVEGVGYDRSGAHFQFGFS